MATARYKATPPTYADGDPVDVLTDAAGRQVVAVASGGGGAATIADGADVAEGAVADAAVAAGAAGTVSAKLRRLTTDLDAVKTAVGGEHTDAIMNGTTALTPKFATIVASASGATTLVAAVSSKKIRVLSYVITANAAVNAKFQSHVTPTDKTGLLYFGANGGVSANYSPLGHFETIAGEALDINLSGAVAVGGHLTYVEV